MNQILSKHEKYVLKFAQKHGITIAEAYEHQMVKAYKEELMHIQPEQSDWKRQIDIVEYYSGHEIGSIILYDDERSWSCVIDDNIEFLNAETEEEAKKEIIARLEEHFQDEINYYRELIEGLDEMIQ